MNKLPEWWVKNWGTKPYAIADCVEAMKKIPERAIDMIFTDPWYYPENQSTRNAFEDEVFWATTKKWMLELKRIIKKDGHIFITFSSSKMAKFEYLLMELLMPLQSRIIWHYRNAGGRCADKGRFGKTFEMIYHIGYGDTLNFPEKWGDERFDVWTIAMPQSNFKDKKVHPFQKPIELLNRIVSLGSWENDVIFDPFLGSGTTLEACRRNNRVGLGFEINPEYEALIRERMAQETIQESV